MANGHSVALSKAYTLKVLLYACKVESVESVESVKSIESIENVES